MSERAVQFCSLTDWVVWGTWRTIRQTSSSSLFFRRHCEQFWHVQGCSLFDVVHPAFPLPITASSTLQGSLEDGFGEAVVACDMPEPCKFLSLDRCQKRFSCEPTRKLILLCTQLLVLCSKCSLFYLLSQTCFKRASSFKLQCSNNW